MHVSMVKGFIYWGIVPISLWNKANESPYETRCETGYETRLQETTLKPGMKPCRYETGYETGYETEPQNDLFEAGLKPGMKPQNSNQGFSGFLVGGASKATWRGVFGPTQNNNHANTEQLTDYGASDCYETAAQKTSLQ